MNITSNGKDDFQFQLDEFYPDLGSDRHSIKLISKNNIEQEPYPGLRPFKTSEFFLFNGRDGQAEELISRLRNNHFLAVIGSSGTGKSSLVRAGLIPQLMGGYLHEVGSKWDIAVCKPGTNPVENLAIALARVKCGTDDRTAIKEQYEIIEPLLSNNIYGILDVYGLLNPAGTPGEQSTGLMILVDQFEELFRFDRKELGKPNLENQFINLLLQAAANTSLPVYVVITMRSEFLGDCVKFRGLPEAINNGQYLVPQLSREQIRQVIEGPIRLAGKKIAPGLVEFLVNEIEGSKSKKDLDQLPILQHTLMRTYQHALKEPGMEEITYSHYVAVGGMEKALANHAQEKYDSLGNGSTTASQKQEVARIVFQALTDSGSDKKGGRRPTELKYLYAISKSVGADEQTVNEVIDHFRDTETSFIMPPPNTKLFAELKMDISHESLMRQWDTLKKWMAEEQESAEKFKYYSKQVTDKREPLTGMDLAVANKWLNEQKPTLEWCEKYARNYDDVVDYLKKSNARQKSKAFWIKVIYGGIFLLVILGFYALSLWLKSQDLKKSQVDVLALTKEPFYSSPMMEQEGRDKWVISLVKKKYEKKGEENYNKLLTALNNAAAAYASKNLNIVYLVAKAAHETCKDPGLDTVLTDILNAVHYSVKHQVALGEGWDRNNVLYAVSKDKKYLAAKFTGEIKIFKIFNDSLQEIKQLSLGETYWYISPYYSAMDFTDSGRLVVYSDRTVYKFNPADNFNITKTSVLTGSTNYDITAISPGADLLALAEFNTKDKETKCVILDISKKQINQRSIKATITVKGEITSLRFSPDGKNLLVGQLGDRNKQYGIFDLSGNEEDSANVLKVTGSNYAETLQLYTDKKSIDLPGEVNRLVFANDGSMVIAGSVDNKVLYSLTPTGSAPVEQRAGSSKTKSISLDPGTATNPVEYFAIIDESTLLSSSINDNSMFIELRKEHARFKNINDALQQLALVNFIPLSLTEKLENGLVNTDTLQEADQVEIAAKYFMLKSGIGNGKANQDLLNKAYALYTGKRLLGTGKPDSNWRHYLSDLAVINEAYYDLDSNINNYIPGLRRIIEYKKLIMSRPELKALPGVNYSSDLGKLSYYQVLDGDYAGAIATAKKGLAADPKNEWINTNLALGYLLSGSLDSAMVIYNRHSAASAELNGYENLSTSFIEDLEQLEQRGILPSKNKNIQNYVDKLKQQLTVVDSMHMKK